MPALAQNVTILMPKKKVGTQKPTEVKQKIRVAAYARVSTDNEEQETSYEAQVDYYTNYIKSHEDWEFVGVYADDGISGTNTGKRKGFNQMIEDCEAGLIDKVITKSISRFARNTVDCLRFTRRLKELNIDVFFEKENIHTTDSSGEVMLTIMAAMAQQESESLSQNVKLGLKYRNEKGKVQINHNRFLGYTKDDEGTLIIDPEQAEVVKRIFREYLQGASVLQIKRGLEADGIKNGAGNLRWHVSNIQHILTNEKYIGDALLQKTVTYDLLEKKRKKNVNDAPQYYVSEAHEAIIPKDLYYRVQEEMARRSNLLGEGNKRRVYSGRYALTGVIYCGVCGDVYRRIVWSIHGRKQPVWRCVCRMEEGKDACEGRTIDEGVLHNAIVRAVNILFSRREDFAELMKKSAEEAISTDAEKRIREIDEECKALQIKLMGLPKESEETDRIGSQICRMVEEKNEILTEKMKDESKQQRMESMLKLLEDEPDGFTEYDDSLVRSFIERITVLDCTLMVKFKSGIEIEVAA